MKRKLIEVMMVTALLAVALCGTAAADAVSYSVTVNTSSISGTSGSLDFQFNPGGSSQLASMLLSGFAGGTLNGSPDVAGDVTGTLPGAVTFQNTAALNDYFQAYTFGNSLTFNVLFSGPALTSPDGTSTSGSSFALSLFSDAAGTTPTLTGPSGFPFIVNVNLNGTTTAINDAVDANGAPVLTYQSSAPAVPEPASLVLLGSGALVFLRRFKK